MKYLPWGLVGLLAVVLVWSLLANPMGQTIGTVNMLRVVDESPRAQALNVMLSERYNELIAEFNLGPEGDTEDPTRPEREREAYASYLAYRQELEDVFQAEVNKAVAEVAKGKKVSVVVDEDIVRFGGQDLSDDVIRKLK